MICISLLLPLVVDTPHLTKVTGCVTRHAHSRLGVMQRQPETECVHHAVCRLLPMAGTDADQKGVRWAGR